MVELLWHQDVCSSNMASFFCSFVVMVVRFLRSFVYGAELSEGCESMHRRGKGQVCGKMQRP